jgi:hypothetical protein
MTKLSDTQLLILSAAAQRDDRNVLPLPGSLRGGAATKVVGALLSRGLIAETTTDSQTKADAALNRIWRNDEDGRAILLHITDAGLAAIGVEPEDAPDGGDTAPEAAEEAPSTDAATEAAPDAAPAPKARKPREGTKQAQLIAMLRTPEGATIDDIVAATGWQPHTVRGAFAGALKKKLGLEVTSDKVEGRGRVYRLEA